MKKQKKQLLELAKQAYNSSDVCQQWKDKILEVCPEFKPTLEVGKWYKVDEEPNTLWFIESIRNDFGVGYGICFGDWRDYCDSIQINKPSYYTFAPATDKEVEEALIKEAKKRYKIGDKIKIFNQENNDNELRGFSLDFINDENVLSATNGGYDCLFDKGKWAEIISEPVKKMTVSEICKELGYDVEIIKD